MLVETILHLVLAFWLGALVGIERGIYENETEQQQKPFDSFGWVRSFWLISFLWALLGLFSLDFWNSALLIIWIAVVTIFIISFYIISSIKNIRFSLSSELAAIITFFIWVLVSTWHYQLSIFISIMLTLVLSSEIYIDKLIDKISRQEFNSSIKFAVIAIIILPLLPNYSYSIAELLNAFWYAETITNEVLTLNFFNPYWLWLFVVLMSWISYIGYIMSKFIWEKSTILAQWALWGMASSTALTASMSELSKWDIKNRNMYVVATLIASIMMFLRVIIIIVIFNTALLSSILFPSLLMLAWLVLYIIFFYIRSQRNKEDVSHVKSAEKFKSPFRVTPALKFAWIVLLTKFIAWLWTVYSDIFWDWFFYALWIISGWADADALAQTMAVTQAEWMVWATVAATAIILWVMSNNMVKWIMALKFWDKKYWAAVMAWFVVTMILGVIWLFLMRM